MVKTTLGKRVISGLIMLGLCLWYIFAAPRGIFTLLTFFLAAVGTYEFHRALSNRGIQLSFTGLMINNGLFYLGVWLFFHAMIPIALLMMVLPLPVSQVLGWMAAPERRRNTFLWYLTSVFWISIPLSLLVLVRFLPENQLGAQLLLWIMLVVSGNDTFAYLGGVRFGKHLLAPKISPKKTIEGSLFGLLGGITGSFLCCWGVKLSMPLWGTGEQVWLGDVLSIGQLIWMPLLIVPLAQVGDLVESRFKRFCSIKDSSNIIPGHGGLLDRSDAYLLVLPIFFILTCLSGLTL